MCSFINTQSESDRQCSISSVRDKVGKAKSLTESRKMVGAGSRQHRVNPQGRHGQKGRQQTNSKETTVQVGNRESNREIMLRNFSSSKTRLHDEGWERAV